MNKYTIVKLVGAGGEAKALLVKKNGTDLLYVMKQRNFLNLEQANEGLNEAISLAKITNQNIVKFEEVFIYYNSEIFSLCIVMEYCDGGDLMDFLFNVILDSNNVNGSSSQNTSSTTSSEVDEQTQYQRFLNSIQNTYTPSSSSSSNCSSSSSFLNIPVTSPTIHPMSPVIGLSHLNHKLAAINNSSSDDNISSNQTDDNQSTSSSSQDINDQRGIPFINNIHNSSTSTLEKIGEESEENDNESSTSSSINNNLSPGSPRSPRSPNNSKSPTSISPLKPRVSLYLTSSPPVEQLSPVLNSSSSSNTTTTTITKTNNNSGSTKKQKKSWWKSHRKSKSKDSIEENKKSSSSSSSSKEKDSKTKNSGTTPVGGLSPRTSSAPKAEINVTPRLQLPKKILYQWLYQISLGVQAIHAAHFIHRDLKSENIFLNNFQVKIGDFGLATKYDTSIQGIAGTYYYSAPEVLSNKSYSRPADIFSLGCIFYEMVTLQLLPLTKRCIGDELNNGTFNRDNFLLEFPIEYYQLAELILDMLNLNPNLRPSMDLIVQHKVFDRLKRNSQYHHSNNLNNSYNNNNNNNNSNNNNNIQFGVNNIGSINGLNSFGSPEISLSNYNNNNIMGNSLGGYRKQIDRKDVISAASILTEAMSQDPRFEYLSGNRSRNPVKVEKSGEFSYLIRKNFFETGAKAMITERFMFWGYYSNDNVLQGAAGWLLPDKKKAIPIIPMILKIISLIPKLGLGVMKKMGILSGRIDKALRKTGDSDGTYLLAYIGMSKEYRNRGVGPYLLQPVLEWADCTNRRCKAVVFNQKSLSFFMKIGFEVAIEEKEDLPRGLDPIFILVRNPRPK